MADTLLVVCPHCAAANRVPAARLADGGTCGKCRQAAVRRRAAANLNASQFRPPHRPLRPAGGGRFLGALVRPLPHHGAGLRQRRRANWSRKSAWPRSTPRAEPQLAARFGIRSIPTLAIFRDGREVARQSGAIDPQRCGAGFVTHL